RRLALRVVKVSGNGDNSLVIFLAEIVFSRLLHLLKNDRRDFRWAPLFPTSHDTHVAASTCTLNFIGNLFDLFSNFVIATSHKSLNRIDSIFGVGYRLPFSNLTNKAASILCESHDRWRGATTFGISDYGWLAPFHHRHDRVGCS